MAHPNFEDSSAIDRRHSPVAEAGFTCYALSCSIQKASTGRATSFSLVLMSGPGNRHHSVTLSCSPPALHEPCRVWCGVVSVQRAARTDRWPRIGRSVPKYLRIDPSSLDDRESGQHALHVLTKAGLHFRSLQLWWLQRRRKRWLREKDLPMDRQQLPIPRGKTDSGEQAELHQPHAPIPSQT
jgi:hypothetical protein